MVAEVSALRTGVNVRKTALCSISYTLAPELFKFALTRQTLDLSKGVYKQVY